MEMAYIIKFKDPFFNLDMQVIRGTKDEVAIYTGAKDGQFSKNQEPLDCVVEIWELDMWRAYLIATDEFYELMADEDDLEQDKHLPVLTKEEVEQLEIAYDRKQVKRNLNSRLIDNLDIDYLKKQEAEGKINLIKL